MNFTCDPILPMFNGSTNLPNKSSDHLSVYSRIYDSFNDAVPYAMSILCVAISCSNALVLSAFVINKQLRTPFSVYLINLLVSDLAQSLLDLPFTTMGGFLPVWPLGRKACNFSLYGKWVYSAVVRNTHSLISFNRVWALFFPIHYKQNHTNATAIWLCVATWVYVHIWLLPGLIPDDLYYRLDDGSCQVNTTANPTWALPTQIVLYNSSVFVVAITYPAIWWKVGVRARMKTEFMHVRRDRSGLSRACWRGGDHSCSKHTVCPRT
ncbi:hypothetical protein RvY_06294 [Ramazzottius varieornatus]|uniref:G-protein coupled receptors family 1 profile domain-containing protein n=1 Tax=Ramazzottius varieornatus TaxID=947166 RepID=A0A1D1V7Q5_RAMVA|nr:hypothetical protein RvY_06294 [Ramazzottius varieornatus]